MTTRYVISLFLLAITVFLFSVNHFMLGQKIEALEAQVARLSECSNDC